MASRKAPSPCYPTEPEVDCITLSKEGNGETLATVTVLFPDPKKVGPLNSSEPVQLPGICSVSFYFNCTELYEQLQRKNNGREPSREQFEEAISPIVSQALKHNLLDVNQHHKTLNFDSIANQVETYSADESLASAFSLRTIVQKGSTYYVTVDFPRCDSKQFQVKAASSELLIQMWFKIKDALNLRILDGASDTSEPIDYDRLKQRVLQKQEKA